MTNRLVWALAAVAGISATATSWGASLTLYPGAAGLNVVGDTATSSPGFGTSSWQANAGAGGKSELYIPVASLFTEMVKISDIASISYWTNKPGNAGAVDWTLELYTNTTGSGDEASWYHSRLNAEPYFTSTSNAADPSNTWHMWSTNDATNPLRFYDQGRDGGVYGTYTDPTLAQLQAGSVTWSGAGENGTSDNYSAETIEYFSLQTGSDWANGFNGLLDGMTITLKDGSVGTVNFEAAPVPLPSGAGMGFALLGMLGIGGLLRSRLCRKPA